MGIFDFVGDLAQSAVEVVKTPVNIVTDIVGITENETSEGISKAGQKLTDAMDEIVP